MHHEQDCLDIDLHNFSGELFSVRHAHTGGWAPSLHGSRFTWRSAALWIIPPLFKTSVLYHSQHRSSIWQNACSNKFSHVGQGSSLPLVCPSVLLADASWVCMLAWCHWVHLNLHGFFNQICLSCPSSSSFCLTHWSPINWIIQHFQPFYLASAFIN